MVDWRFFWEFCNTGIPSWILYPSLFVAVMLIIIGLWSKQVKKKERFVVSCLLLEYLFVLICSTLVCRGQQFYDYARLELEPLWTYSAVLSHVPGVSVWDIILNVVLFIPLGFLVRLLIPTIPLWKMVGIAMLISLFIETNQYFFEKGICQFDDLMHNMIGCVIGWGLGKFVLALISKMSS